MSLGEEIRRLRTASGLSVPDLATRAGMREAYLAAIEDGREEPSSTALGRLAANLAPAGANYHELARLMTAPEFDFWGEHAGERGRQPSTAPSPGERVAGAAPTIPGKADAGDDPLATLTLEHAQFEEAGGRTCAACARALGGSYFQVNGRIVCASCCDALRERLNAGAGWSRAVRAASAGLGAAVAGTIVYYAVLAATGYSVGLVAILVGYMVGKSVRWGSNGRGGWRYQALAMVLMYLSIVGSYMPAIVGAIAKQGDKSTTAQSQLVREGDRQEAPRRAPTAVGAPGAFVILLLLASALPFAMGLQHPLSLAIIGFGVYEAWKLNRRLALVISGPHALGAAVTQPAGA